MAILRVSPDAYFVVDGFSYKSQIQEYDPHVTSQTLITFNNEPEGGVAVLGEDFSEYLDDPDDFLQAPVIIDVDDRGGGEEAEAREELKRITPPNAELLKLADRFPAPQEWYDE